MEEKIFKFLLRCGFSPKHYGYRYLKIAIKYYIERELDVRYLGDKMYSMLSKKADGKSKKTIEKNITTAIEWAYLKGDVHFLEKSNLFGSFDKGRPTNSEFIALAANYILYSYDLDIA